ncbi:hypothetical protein FM123_08000 [Limosilactobacillus fermentum]|nr:hypothetical protein FM122_02990 [Limosilactobacillus fermentum]SJM60497.1 hypothetical protein FM123_08000 [Limosilactobacillus fermentum]
MLGAINEDRNGFVAVFLFFTFHLITSFLMRNQLEINEN